MLFPLKNTCPQVGSKGDFPGPVPVVRDGVTSVRDVAEAAALGCTAVAVNMNEVGAERVGQVIAWGARLGLETVVRTSAAKAEAAVAAGAKIVCVLSDSSDEIQMRGAVAGFGKSVVRVAEVSRAQDGSEVRTW